MRKGGGKQKGAQFEREACVMLSRWITRNAQDDVFWRSAMSGGRSTVAFKGGKVLKNQVGDISCIDPIGFFFIKDFAVECKFYANLEIQALLMGRGKLLQFWREINKQAKGHNKRPFLIFRQNRMPTYVCLSIDGRKLLGLSYKDMLQINVPHNLHILRADHFVKVCKPYVASNWGSSLN